MEPYSPWLTRRGSVLLVASAFSTELTRGLVIVFLALTGVALAVVILRVVRLFAELRRCQKALIETIETDGMPSAISQMNGDIVHITEALAVRQDQPATTMRELLSQCGAAVDDGLIYRLCQAAAGTGFAIRPLGDTKGEAETYLSCRRYPDDLLVWTLISSDDVGQILGQEHPEPPGASGLTSLLITPDQDPVPSPEFTEIFGDQVQSILDQIGPVDAPRGLRLTLTRADRRTEAFQILPVPQEEDGTLLLFLSDAATPTPPGNATKALDLLPVALMQFDLQGRLIWLNQLGVQVVVEKPALGTSVEEIFAPLGRPIPALLEEAMSGTTNRRGTMVRLAGQKTGGFLQISLIRSELDGVDCFLAVLNDASELRELEDRFAQSQKMEAVGKLAGGVAHDFNNVLTAIKGHCDFVLMGKEQTNPDYEDLVQIRQNSNRAASMVRHLLAFSRQQTLQPQMLNLRDVISDAHVFLNSVIGERVVLHIDHERELWPVMADQHQLEQVLMNLVVNARDAMDDGGVVTIATRNVNLPREEAIQGISVPADDYVEISVTDDGTGIPEEVIDRVFDPFFTTKPQGQGTGLGLSTVYGIVKQSGGYIFAQNLEEGGACFRLLMPCASPGTQRAVRDAPAEQRQDLTGQATVLLVEDEDSIRSVGSRALKLRGYHVHEAASAEDAMKMLSEDKITVDVLVSDVVMPGMDGPTFAVKARKIRPGLRLIFVSGYAEDNFQNADLGEDFLFLPKPFSINELTAKVKEALDVAA